MPPVDGLITMQSGMRGFAQTGAPTEGVVTRDFGTTNKSSKRTVAVRTVPCSVAAEPPCSCPRCGCMTEGDGRASTELWHVPQGLGYVRLRVERRRLRCRSCGWSGFEPCPFKAAGHRVTLPLLEYVWALLEMGETLKSVSLITGLGKNVVKAIDKERLERLYTEAGPDGKRRLKRPERQSRYIGIDEFKLHDGHRFATVVIDLEDGRVLYLAHGKRKQVVYDFCDFVGKEWMDGVVGVACDMNATYEVAFKERHPHLVVVYDHFHLVKNFNDKVISEVRKDEQRRLREAGEEDAAKALKGSKYILMTKRATRRRNDRDARAGRVVSRGNELFGKPEARAKGGQRSRYKRLVAQNELLSACDIVKEMLDKAYRYSYTACMRDMMEELVSVCRGTGNRHFEWFARLVEGHIDGILAHARHHISSGRVEGTNTMIKTLRRAGYGYPDDEYFFLKIFDRSRRFVGREAAVSRTYPQVS